MKPKIGFIGLGVMGLPMCRNLLAAEYEVIAFNRSKGVLEKIALDGASIGESSADVASQSDVIITMLPNSPDVKAVVLGESGVLEGAKPGSIIIDMSSIAPAVSQEVAKAAQAKGVRFMDAPVSGGEPGAVAGTLAIMVGGSEKDFGECVDILKVMGKSVTLVGKIGAGNTTKLTNQIIVALNIAAVGEAFVLGTKAGVDPEAIYNAIRGGLAGSNVMDAKVPLLLDRKFDPGFRIELHMKDLANALQTGKDVGVPLPFSGMVMEVLQALKVADKGTWDHGAISTFFESLAGITVSRQDTKSEAAS